MATHDIAITSNNTHEQFFIPQILPNRQNRYKTFSLKSYIYYTHVSQSLSTNLDKSEFVGGTLSEHGTSVPIGSTVISGLKSRAPTTPNSDLVSFLSSQVAIGKKAYIPCCWRRASGLGSRPMNSRKDSLSGREPPVLSTARRKSAPVAALVGPSFSKREKASAASTSAHL